MNVILKETVRGLGRLGDTVSVRPGYARNFLLPRAMVLLATNENAEDFSKMRKALESKELERQKDFDLAASKINELETLSIAMRASEEGRLYGAVTASSVVALLKKEGITIGVQQVKMPEVRIREVGEYELSFPLTSQVSAACKLVVSPEASGL